jgi:ketosteroid isomerase-like protein
MSHNDVERLVGRYRAGWFGHDVDAIMATVSADIVFHNVTAAERVEGAEAFRAHVAGIHERWPDLRFEEPALYLADDTRLLIGLRAPRARCGPYELNQAVEV